MPAAPIAIIFDLDGTLVDTAPDLLAALNAVLVVEGHEPIVPKDLRHIVGHGAKAMFEHALLRTGAPVTPERLAALTPRRRATACGALRDSRFSLGSSQQDSHRE